MQLLEDSPKGKMKWNIFNLSLVYVFDFVSSGDTGNHTDRETMSISSLNMELYFNYSVRQMSSDWAT